MSGIAAYTPWPKALASLYRDCGYWSGETLLEILKQGAREKPNKLAIQDSNNKLSYAELLSNSESLAYGFWQLGFKQGDRVVLQMPNCIAFYEVLFALMCIGVAPVLALPLHREKEIAQFCKQSGARAYISVSTGNGCPFRVIADYLLRNDLVERVVLDGAFDGCISLRSLQVRVDESFQAPLPSADGVALYQLSGGTTGLPKLIPRTHNDYFYSVRASAEICQLSAQTKYLVVMPLAHNFILSSPGALGVLYVGGSIFLAPDPSPCTAFKWIELYGVSMCALVPPLVQTWLNAFENSKVRGVAPDISSLSLLQAGGAKLSACVAEKITPVLGCQLQQVFGMAEGLVNYTRLDDSYEAIVNTQGKPMSPADEIRVVDDEDNSVPTGEEGHLLTRGPYTIQGYYRSEQHNKKSFTSDGFYRTGDIVKLLPSGHLVVTGRSKDQINKGGEKISAEEIENYLLQDERILDAAVVAMADEYLGERVCAFLVLNNRESQFPVTDVSASILKCFKDLKIASFKVPDRIEVLSRFPYTKFGKIDKRELRDRINKKLQIIHKESKKAMTA